jgi:hypothetical protein
MRADRALLRALAVLIALGLGTTALAALRDDAALVWPAAAAAALLVLAGLKAEIILARYLALNVAPAWLRGFRAALVLLLAILYALWLVPLLA